MIVLIIDNMSFINKEGNIMKNNNIEEIRSKKGISLDTLASKLQISPEKLESIENGEEEITFELLSRISSELHVSVNDIMSVNKPLSEFEKKRLLLSDIIWVIIGTASTLLFLSIIISIILKVDLSTDRTYQIYYLISNWNLDNVVIKLILVACVVLSILSIVFVCKNRKKYKE